MLRTRRRGSLNNMYSHVFPGPEPSGLELILPATSALLAFINMALAHHIGTAEKPMTAEQVRKIVREELAHTR